MSDLDDSRWINIDPKKLGFADSSKTLDDFIIDSGDETSKKNFLGVAYTLFFASKWPSLSGKEAEKLIEEYWEDLIRIYSENGISEIKAIKNLLVEKNNELQSELESIPQDVEFDIDWNKRLAKIGQLLERKIKTLDKFLTVYAVKGGVKALDDYSIVRGTPMEKVIKTVSISISQHANAKYSAKAIDSYLKAYVNFKGKSRRIKREQAIKECSDNVVRQELSDVAVGSLKNWEKGLQEKINEIENYSVFFERE